MMIPRLALNALMALSISILCASLGFAKPRSLPTKEYLLVTADHANLTYQKNENAVFRIRSLIKPTNPEERIVVEGFFQGAPADLAVSGSIYTFIRKLSDYGSYTFTARAFLENARIVDTARATIASINFQIEEIQNQINDGSEDPRLPAELQRLSALKISLEQRIQANHKLMQEKSVTVTVPNPAIVVTFTTASQTVPRNQTTAINVTATLDRAPTQALTIPLTVSGTMPANGYANPGTSIAFAAGQTSKTISFLLTANAQADKTIILTLGTTADVILGATPVHTVNVGADALPTITSIRPGLESSGGPPFYAQFTAIGVPTNSTISALEFDFGDSKVVTIPFAQYRISSYARHLYTNAGTYEVKVTPIGPTNNRGTTFQQTFTIGASESPKGKITVTPSAAPRTVHLSAAGSIPGAGSTDLTYKWVFDDGTELNGMEVDKTFGPASTQIVRLRAMDQNMHRGYAQTTLSINPTTNAVAQTSFNYSIQSLTYVGQAPLTVNFDVSASTTIAGNPISNVRWNFADGTRMYKRYANGPTASNTYKIPGVYFPSVIVTDPSGNTFNQSLVVVVLGAPLAQNTLISPMMTPPTPTFIGSRITRSKLSDYNHSFWNFGDGLTGSGTTDIPHGYPANPASTTVKYEGFDVFGDTFSLTKTFANITAMSSYPNLSSLTMSKYAPAPNESFDTMLTIQANGQPVSGLVDYDDGSPIETVADATAPISHAYVSPGIYFPTFFVQNAQGFASRLSSSIQVVQGFAPMAVPSANVYACAIPCTIQFSAEDSYQGSYPIEEVYWDFNENFGAGGSSLEMNPQYTFNAQGERWVSLFIRDTAGNISWTFIRLWLWLPSNFPTNTIAPTADFTFSNNLSNVNFYPNVVPSAGRTIIGVAWDFGDTRKQHTNSASPAFHTYAAAGVYPVKMTAIDDAGKTTTFEYNVTVAGGRATEEVQTASKVPLSEQFGKYVEAKLQQEAFWLRKTGCTQNKNGTTHCINIPTY